MGIEDKLEEEDSPIGVEKKRKWRRRVGEFLAKVSTPVSAGVGLVMAGIVGYTFYQFPELRSQTAQATIGGALVAGEIKGGIEFVVDHLLRDTDSETGQTEAKKQYSFLQRYWHMIPGAGLGIVLGKQWIQDFIDQAQHLYYLISEYEMFKQAHTVIQHHRPDYPSFTDTYFLHITQFINAGTISGAFMLTGLLGATIVCVVATQVPLSHLGRYGYAKLLDGLGRTEDAVKIYQRLEQEGTPESIAGARYAIAQTQKKQKNQGGFLLSVRSLIEKAVSLRDKIGYDPLATVMLRERITKAEKKRDRNLTLDAHLDLAYEYMAQGYTHDADATMEETARRYPTPEVRLLHVVYRETRGDRSLHAGEEKRRALVDVLKEGGKREAFQQQGEHRNEVLFYKPEQSVFLAGTLVYKRNRDPTGLETEERNLRFLRTRLGNRVVRVLDVFADRGLHYLALLYAGDKTLADSAPKLGQDQGQENERKGYVEQVRECLDLLVEIQYVMEVNIDTIALDPVGQREECYFTSRLRDVFFGQLKQHGIQVDADAEKAIMRAHTCINDELRALPRDQLAFYTDANPGNWFIDEQGNITRGDLESNRLLPVYFDLLLLFDFLGETLSQRDRGELELHYLKARAQRFGTSIDHRAFGRMKRIAGYHKHLEQAGYKVRDAEWSRRSGKDPQEHYTVAYCHLKRAGHCLDQMDYYCDVPRQHHTLLSDARFALAGMLINR